MILTSNGVHEGRRPAKSRGPRSTRNRYRPMVLDRLEERLLMAGTNLAVAAASGTYGGSTNLLVHLTSGGNNVSGEIIDFQMGGNELGTSTTDANGLAFINNVSIFGNNVGTYTGDVTAEFTGDAGAGLTASSGAADLTVTTAPLTITANNQSKVYGASLPTLTASYTGLVNGDTSASLATAPTITTTATAASHVAGSPYAITASGAVDTNYSISYVDGSLSVTTAPLTITANNLSKVYGAALPTLTASYTGLVNGDTSASLATPPTITTTATAASHVSGSPYAITASGAVDTDYAISYVAGSLAVTTAPLTITANNLSKVYGAALPTLTASYTGLVNGDTSASLATPPTITTTATAASHFSGSPYSITASAAVDTDYTISYVAGTLSVTKAPLTITANNLTKVYGAALPTLTASYTGLVNGDTSASLATPPTITTTATAASHISGSPYAITASGAVDTDYTISYVAGSLAVTTAPLTITANNLTKVYGAALPTLTASYTGFVNGDTSANLIVLPSITTTATAASHVSGSPYAITANTAIDSDYAISYVAGSLAVTTAPLTITADGQTKVYGAALPTLTASYTGFVNGDTSASLSTAPTITTTATAASNVGANAGNPYAITASGAIDSDYTISYVGGLLTVTTAPLTITADDQTKVYGAALPSLTVSYSGFVLGQIADDLSFLPSVTTTATAASHVSGSPYSITASGAVSADYSFIYVDGSLSVTTAPLTITANNLTKVYGAALPTLTASYTGLVNGDTSASLATPPTITSTADATSHVSGSPYAITASAAVDTDYAISYVAGSLAVTTAPLTITANNLSKVYGAALPTLTASYTGLVNGDTSASLATPPTITSTADATSHVSGSPYAITASAAVDTDYTISYVAGSLAVTTAPLTITADNQTKVYGAALPTLTVSYTGFVNGDTSATLATAPTIVSTATAASHVALSPYAITASGAVDTDYSINYVAGSLNVTTALLTITADNQTKVYGAALPTLTASYTGLVNGDTSANLLTPPTIVTTATAASHVSPGLGNPFVVTASGAVDSDYSISYVQGSLIVTPAPSTITANDQTKAYGTALPAFTASYTGLVNGDTSASLLTLPSLSTGATAASHVSGSPYTITASGAVDPDYTISYASGNLSITPVALTITANDQTKVYGAALPTFTASYTGLVNGDTSASLAAPPTITSTGTAGSHVSGSPYAITASGAVDTDYTISYLAGNLTVTSAPLTITANDQTKVYGAALPTLTASYTGLVNGDTSASLATPPTVATLADATSHVASSPFAITASGAVDTDYTISYLAGNLTVTSAPLTITADNQTKVYGAALPNLTASYTGFVNGDTSAILITSPTISTTADATSHVAGSPYAITASGAAVGTDYTISYAAGNLSVTAAPLTITADNQTKAYGAALPTLTASYAGFVNGDTSANLIDPPTLATTATSGSNASGSPYAITASGAASGDYTIAFVAGNLSVTPVPLQVTANSFATTYGQAIPTLTAAYSGFVNGDSASSLTTPVSLTTTASSASDVGSYPVVASGATSGNYTVSYTNGSASVTPATLTVTPNNLSTGFGVALPSLTATYSGFVNGNTAASLTTPVTLSTTATPSSTFGTYPITASGGSASNYTIVDGQGTLTIATDPVQVAFVSSLYQNILGRAPETAGLDAFLEELSSGGTQSEVVAQIYFSGEAAADRTTHGVAATSQAPGQIGLVVSLYQNILGRAPEAAGLNGWLAELNSGVSPESVANQIYNSPEALADRAASPPPTAPTNAEEVGLVTSLYQTILNRTPEPTGLAGWIAELNSGTSAASVASQIANSPEALALKAKPTA